MPGVLRRDPKTNRLRVMTADESDRINKERRLEYLRRQKNSEWAWMYNRSKWRKASREFRKENPLCAMCQGKGIVKASEIVDHIREHKGDEGLFWERSNWQALCRRCHLKKTAEDKRLARRV